MADEINSEVQQDTSAPAASTATATPPGAATGKDIASLKYKAEQLQRENTELQTKLDSSSLSYSTAHTKTLEQETRITSLEEDLAKHSGAATALAEAQQKLEAASTEAEALRTAVLGHKRTILTSYGMPLEQTEGKTLHELDALEVAVKALTSGTIGNYAIGGGGGAAPAPETPTERATRLIKEAGEKGHIYGGSGTGGFAAKPE